jgi:hypothetical protein
MMDKKTIENAVMISRKILADVVVAKRRSILEHQQTVSMSVRDFANVAWQLELLTQILEEQQVFSE